MTYRLFSLACLAFITGCSDFDAEEIRHHQRAWQSLHISDYAFVYDENCFCDSHEVGGTRVEVRDGEVVSASGARSGVACADSLDRDLTIDDLFAKVLQSTRHGADRFDASYHPRYHFFERLSLDQDDEGEDDEYKLAVTCFSKDPDGCAVPTLTPDACAARDGEVRAVPEPKPFFEFVCGNEDGHSPLGQIDPGVTVCCTHQDSTE